MVNENHFSIFILFSICLHIILFNLFKYVPPKAAKIYEYSEVEMSKISFAEVVKEKTEPELKIVDKKTSVDIRDETKTKSKVTEDTPKLKIPLNKGYQLVSPKFGVNLPERAAVGEDFQIKAKNDKGAPTDIPFGESEVAEHNIVKDTHLFDNREGVYQPGLENGKDIPNAGNIDGHYSKFREKYVPPKEKISKEIIKDEPLFVRETHHFGGTIGDRKVLYKPKAPEILLDKDIEIEVKFFVLPNGQVREAMPIIKGDAELETIAIQYMKAWIFVPLPRDVEQLEQWGTMKIKFKKISRQR